MKKMLKKITVAILGAVLLLSSVAVMFSCKKEDKTPPTQPPYVEVEPTVIVGDLIYQFSNGSYYEYDAEEGKDKYFEGEHHYIVIGVSNADANKIVIPAYVDGKPVRTIADSAFYANANIVSVEIPSTVTKIGERAFASCISLMSIEVSPDSEKFKSVDGNLYTKDGAELLQYATGKSDSAFAVPEDVITIGSYAFANARINSLTLNAALTEIQEFAFAGLDIVSIDIPGGVEEIAASAFNACASLTGINVSSDNSNYKSVGGNLYTKDLKSLVRYAPGKDAASFAIPSSVKSIEKLAFAGSAALTKIDIPAGVASIASDAFDDCGKLSSIDVSAQNTNYASTSGVLFNKNKTEIIKYPSAKSGTKYELPANVTHVASYAFKGAKYLEKLTLSAKLEYIGTDAFDSCDKLLFNTSSGINYLGTSSNQYYALISLSSHAVNTLKSIDAKSGTVIIAGGALADSQVIETVRLSNTVKYVCNDAFANCSALKLVDFKSIVNVYAGALSHCPSLVSIVLGDSMKLIEENAIVDCPKLKNVFYKSASLEAWEELGVWIGDQDSVNYYTANRYYYSDKAPAELGNHWRYVSNIPTVWTEINELEVSEGLEMTLSANKSYYTVTGIGSFEGSSLVIPTVHEGKPVKEIGGGAFVNSGIRSVVIPYSVESIGANAFTGCSRLASISIDDSVSYIGTGAFKNCVGLTAIDIPDKVAFIEAEAFLGCTALRRVELPERLTAIKEAAFYDCTALTEIELPYGALTIGDEAFRGCTKLATVTLPETFTEIGDRAFASSGLENIEIPVSTLFVSESAFENCSSLRTINVSEYNTEYISHNGVLYRKDADGNAAALIRCPAGYIYPKKTPNDKSAEITMTIPNTVTAIAANAVSGCDVRFIDFGLGLETIGDYAFADCAALAIAQLPASVKTIGKYAFAGSAITSMTVADDAVFAISEGAFKGCDKLAYITLANCTSIGKYAFHGCTALTSVMIPDSVTEIGIFAFYGCERMTEATLGNGIGVIPGNAFADCMALERVNIGNSVSEIAYSAFDGCTALNEINVSAGNSFYKSVGGVLYTDDSKVLVHYPDGKVGATFEIPKNVTTILDYAFSGSAIESIVIPDTVTVIGDSAFFNCKSLTNVTVGAAVEEIGAHAFRNCTALEALEFVEGSAALTIGDEAFSGCSSLTAVELPDRVTDLGAAAFENCRHLKSVIIGEGISEIKQNTFNTAYSLEWIVLGSGVRSIGESAFAGCSDFTAVYHACDRDSYVPIKVEDGNEAFTSALRYYYSATDPNSNMVYWHYDENGNIAFWR